MKIEIARPPNYTSILAVFPLAASPGVIFAYGDTIYNPSGGAISLPLLAHETVHGGRQSMHGHRERCHRETPREVAVRTWWEEYLVDPEFRYHEELLAHTEEMRMMLPTDRNRRAKLLMLTARRLVAPLYSYGVSKSLRQAMRDLEKAFER